MRFLFFILFLLAVLTVNGQRFVRVAGSYSDLQALNVADPNSTNVMVNGYSSFNDGGQGTWSWYPNDSTTTNGGTVLSSTSGGTGRWKRQYSGQNEVKWWGAKADNSTDDQAAIQAAINASVGNKLHIPSGTYKLASSVTIPASVNVFGDGPKTVLNYPSGTLAFSVSSITNSQISAMTVQGSLNQAFRISGSSNLVIDAVVFTGVVNTPTVTYTYTAPIYIGSGNDITISNSKFYGNGFASSATDTNYLNVTSDIVAASGGTVTGLRILNNEVSETAVAIPFQLFDTHNLLVEGNTVNQGNFGNSTTNIITTGYGIISYNSVQQPNSITIRNNTVTNSAGTGIYVVGADLVRVEGNNCYKNALKQQEISIPMSGITIDVVNNAFVTGNRIEDSGKGGIQLKAGVTNFVVSGNTIRGSGTSGLVLSGNTGAANSTNLVVTGNTIISSVERGIYALYLTNAVITANSIFYHTNSYGIDCDYVNQSVFNGNLLSNNRFGIRFQTGSYNMLANNYIWTGLSYVGTGITLGATTTNNIVSMNYVNGFSALYSNTGYHNSVGLFDWASDSGGFNIGTSPVGPRSAIDIVSDSVFAGPVPIVTLQTAGGNGTNGPSIEFYTKDNSGNNKFGARVVSGVDNGGAANYSAFLDVWTTKNNASNRVLRATSDGYLNLFQGLVVSNTAPSGYVLAGDGTSMYPQPIAESWLPSGINANKIDGGSVDNTEFSYLNGVTSSIQAQLDAKASAVAGTLVDVSTGTGGTFKIPVGSDSTGTNIVFKDILAGSGMTVTTNSSGFTLVATASGATAGSIINVSTGTGGTFKIPVGTDSTGTNVVFKDILAGANITVTTNSSGFTIASTAGVGTSGTIIDVSTGTGGTFKVPVGSDSTGTNVVFKDILAGTGITVTTNSSGFTVAATGAGATSGSIIDVSTASGAIFKIPVATDSTGTNVVFKSILAGANMTVTTNSSGFTLDAAGPSGSGVSFAQPTVSIGLSVVNGSSTNAAYANAAPALSQSIAPTWTADHTWSGAYVNLANSYGLKYNSTGTKGSIFVGDGTSYKPLAVGTDGQKLIADSGHAEGMYWVNDFNGTSGTVINSGSSSAFQVATYYNTTGTNVTPKSILAGTGVTITTNSSGFTISSTVSGGGNVYATGTPAVLNVAVASDTTGTNVTFKPVLAGSNITVTTNSSGITITGNAGTVTSAALTLSSPLSLDISVSGSPITSSGTFTLTRSSQAANQFLASPDGSSGTPTYRSIAINDLPSGSRVVYSVGGIQLTNAGTTTVFTVPTGKVFVFTDAQIIDNGLALGGGGQASIGFTGQTAGLSQLSSSLETVVGTATIHYLTPQLNAPGQAYPRPMIAAEAVKVTITANTGVGNTATCYVGGYLY